MRLQKPLYGFLRSTILFYLKLVIDLKNNCFRLNAYNPFVKKNGQQENDDSGMARR